MNILDRVAQGAATTQYATFAPTTPRQFFAFRLASRMQDAGAAHHYCHLAEQYSEGQLLVAFQRAASASGEADRSRRFHDELEDMQQRNGLHPPKSRLLAVRIERRTIAVAIMHGDHLDYTEVRHLSSTPQKAIASAVGFVARVADRFPVEFAALEVISCGGEVLRWQIQDAVLRLLSEQTISTVRVAKSDLFTAYGWPALRSRKQLRQTISKIWPALDEEPGRPLIHDAAALGLYVQTERLFNAQLL